MDCRVEPSSTTSQDSALTARASLSQTGRSVMLIINETRLCSIRMNANHYLRLVQLEVQAARGYRLVQAS